MKPPASESQAVLGICNRLATFPFVSDFLRPGLVPLNSTTILCNDIRSLPPYPKCLEPCRDRNRRIPHSQIFCDFSGNQVEV